MRYRNTMIDLAQRAVAVADAQGKENREQAAIAWLHEAGHVAQFTCDGGREMENIVREVCEASLRWARELFS